MDAAAIGEGRDWSRDDRFLPRALAARGTQVALACVRTAFRRSGSAGLRRPNVFEKLLRDMSVAATPAIVDDAALAAHAQHLIEAGGRIGLLDKASAPSSVGI